MSSRVAVVTGGSGGIGSACAVRLAREGYAVIANFGSDRANADAIVAEIGHNALAVQADVADENTMGAEILV